MFLSKPSKLPKFNGIYITLFKGKQKIPTKSDIVKLMVRSLTRVTSGTYPVVNCQEVGDANLRKIDELIKDKHFI